MDEHLRQDQRRASLGSIEDQARFLLSRIRSGELPRDRVRAAAALGDEAALMVFDDSALLRKLGSYWAHMVIDKIDHLPIAIRWVCWILREDSNRMEGIQVIYDEGGFDRILSPEALVGLTMLETFADALEIESQQGPRGFGSTRDIRPHLLDALGDLASNLREQKDRIRSGWYYSNNYLVEAVIELVLFNVAGAVGAFLRYDDMDMEGVMPRCMADNMSPGCYRDIHGIATRVVDNQPSERSEIEEARRQTRRLLDLLLE